MLFNSLIFPFFLTTVLTAYWCLNSERHRHLLLLAASWVFYGWWDVRFLLLLIATSLVDYAMGLAIGSTESERRRRALLGVSLALNLGLLGTFKYFNFFKDSLAAAFAAIGFQLDWPTLNVVLPVGISFYTFQSLSYTIDVYRRECPVCRDPITFLLFVAYFPQLVAGPIEKAVHLIPELQRRHTFDERQARTGLRYILWGFLLKSVLADNLAPIVTAAYMAPGAHSGAQLLFATYGFAFQIYGDFAGYTYIAIGASRLFGIDLLRNFNYPYLSQSISEFWTRWHISLSTWFREYVYIAALGGNRVSPRRRAVNVLITFLVSGLWHGANWTFVVWGLFNGVFYFVPAPLRGSGRLSAWINRIVAFHIACAGWVFFRAADLRQAFTILGRIVHATTLRMFLAPVRDHLALAGAFTALILIEYLQRRRHSIVDIDFVPRPARYALYTALAYIWFFAGAFNRIPFIYFQF